MDGARSARMNDAAMYENLYKRRNHKRNQASTSSSIYIYVNATVNEQKYAHRATDWPFSTGTGTTVPS